MDKSRPDQQTVELTKKATRFEATGEKKSSRFERNIEKLDLDNCRRQIINILRQRESLDAEIRRIIMRREKMSLLNDFTELISSTYDEVVERINALNPELINDELEEARQALLQEVTKKQKDVLDVKGEITWTRRMLVDTETCLNLQKREYEAVYSCLRDTLAIIAQSREATKRQKL